MSGTNDNTAMPASAMIAQWRPTMHLAWEADPFSTDPRATRLVQLWQCHENDKPTIKYEWRPVEKIGTARDRPLGMAATGKE